MPIGTITKEDLREKFIRYFVELAYPGLNCCRQVLDDNDIHGLARSIPLIILKYDYEHTIPSFFVQLATWFNSRKNIYTYSVLKEESDLQRGDATIQISLNKDYDFQSFYNDFNQLKRFIFPRINGWLLEQIRDQLAHYREALARVDPRTIPANFFTIFDLILRSLDSPSILATQIASELNYMQLHFATALDFRPEKGLTEAELAKTYLEQANAKINTLVTKTKQMVFAPTTPKTFQDIMVQFKQDLKLERLISELLLNLELGPDQELPHVALSNNLTAPRVGLM